MVIALIRTLLFIALAIVGPGLAAQRLIGVPLDPALVVPAGMALCAGAFWAASATGVSVLFPLVVLGLTLAGLLRPGPWRRAEGPPIRGALPVFAALIVLLAVTQYRWNRVGPDGSFLLDPFVAFDTAFHVGLARELVTGYPPQVPGVAGFPLGYHLGLDLVRAAALRWAAVDPYDSIARFDVTLLACALVLALRAAASALGAGPLGVRLAGWTVVLTDFSFAFAANPQAHWWADLLRGNVLVSLALANPVVPALAMALGVAIALRHAQSSGDRRWVAVAATLAAAVPCALATAALALGTGGATVGVSVAPLDLVRTTRDTLGLTPLHGAALAGWAALWLVLSLGLRVLGLPAAARALLSAQPAAVALGAMALAAWPIGLLFRVAAPEMLPGQRFVNDAAYVVEQGGPLLWLFACLALERLAARAPRGPLLVAALLAVLALPSTLQFVAKKATTEPDPIPAAMVRAARAVEAATVPGDVVLQRPGARYPPLPVLLAGRRVAYERFTPWLTQFASRRDLEARHAQVFRFFRTTDAAEARAIAAALHARAVCLYGGERLRFDPAGFLAPLHEEEGALCYRVAR
ncbi:MAG TPA: hypothetical protein VFM29_08600 [Vicinamibacteria bacterium]|nr:hypothetical protein [Vicinamibacteria bacterium]